MWCPTCQQDVPGYGSADGRELRCGKCGESLPGVIQPSRSSNPTPITAAEPAAKSPSDIDVKALLQSPALDHDWALEADLRGVQRLIGSLKSRSTIVAEPLAVHPSHGSPARWHAPPDATQLAPATVTSHTFDANSRADAPQPRSHAAAWTVLCGSVALLAGGVVLIAVSVIAARADLWQIGLPTVVIGQAGLLIGFALQLDSLWHSSRRTAMAGPVSHEPAIARLEAPGAAYSSTGVAAASHAQMASPHLLLSELKSRLDRLVQQPSPPASR